MKKDNLRILAVIPGVENQNGFIFAYRQIQQLRNLGANIAIFHLTTRTNLLGIIKEAHRFREVIASFHPDVVHVHYGTVTALFCVIFSPRPIVITFRGTDLNPSSEFSLLRGIVSRWFSQFAAFFSKRIICVSEELRQRLWWHKSKAIVIPSGVDLSEFIPVDRDNARRYLGWDQSEIIVLFNHGSARSPNKRLDLVEQAILILRNWLPSVRLVTMEGNVSGQIVPFFLNASDVLVLTSDYEGSPTIIQEALACNVPVCSVEVGDVRQMIADVYGCSLVSRSPEAIARGIYDLVRRPLRSNGRAFSHRYSVQSHLGRLYEFLQCAVDK